MKLMNFLTLFILTVLPYSVINAQQNIADKKTVLENRDSKTIELAPVQAIPLQAYQQSQNAKSQSKSSENAVNTVELPVRNAVPFSAYKAAQKGIEGQSKTDAIETLPQDAIRQYVPPRYD